MDSQLAAEAMEGKPGYNRGYEHGKAQAYRVCAAELQALVAVSMEMEAAHGGDPEPEPECPACPQPRGHSGPCVFDPNALLEWSQGRRP